MGLTGSERADLELFCSEAERLRGSPLIVNRFSMDWQLRAAAGGPLVISGSEPPDDAVTVTVHRLRVFLLEDAAIKVERILNLCDTNLRAGSSRDELRDWRRAFKDSLKQGGVAIQIDDEPWTPRRLLHLELNAYYAHSDQEKRAILDRAGPLRPLTHQEFIHTVWTASHCIIGAALCIRRALNRGEFY